jgi:transcriptional regulator with XRE-family HTH domain
LPLPDLKHWRLRKGLGQPELARRVSLTSDYLFKVESGRRGCKPKADELLADLLGVGPQDLRRKPGAAFDMERLPKPYCLRIPYCNVHQAYLRIILEGVVGSAYAAMDEWEIEERCERGTWEDVVRGRPCQEAGDVVLGRRGDDLGRCARGQGGAGRPRPARGVRTFLEGVLGSIPDLGIHVLMTDNPKAMQELL